MSTGKSSIDVYKRQVQGEAVHVESSAVILEWGQVKGAASYRCV